MTPRATDDHGIDLITHTADSGTTLYQVKTAANGPALPRPCRAFASPHRDHPHPLPTPPDHHDDDEQPRGHARSTGLSGPGAVRVLSYPARPQVAGNDGGRQRLRLGGGNGRPDVRGAVHAEVAGEFTGQGEGGAAGPPP